MFENLNAETIVAATGSAGIVGGGAMWLARILVKRLIEQNDKKHEEATKDRQEITKSQTKVYKELIREVHKLQIDTEVIKSRIGECMSLRDQVTNNTKEIAVAQERIAINADDINDGFASVRERLKSLNLVTSGHGGKG